MHAEKKKEAASESTDSPTTSSDNNPEVAPTMQMLFSSKKLIQNFIRQAKLNSHQGLLIQLLQASSFISAGFFLSSAFFNPLWAKMVFILNYHLLKLMTSSNF